MEEERAKYGAAAQAASEASGHRVTLNDCVAYRAFSAARFCLDNGLTIILAPDDTAPIFTYQTWFRVGSRNEDPTRTGLAHLFEHLMFKGTQRYPTGTFDRDMERRGGQTNAATWVDWTHYTETLAALPGNFEVVVGFEADRLTGLMLDEATFRSELDVVKNERRMSVDDSVSGFLAEQLYQLAFQVHPYRWPTIGAMPHLEATTLDELQAFYRTHYAPNNAVLVVVGAVCAEQALRLLASAYGGIAPQPLPRRLLPAEPEQTAPRSATFHRPAVATQWMMAFPIPGQGDRGFAALEMLGDVLAGGESGRLYQRLVIEEEMLLEINAFPTPFADPGLFELHAVLRDGVDPDATIEAVQHELDQVVQGNITRRELNKARNTLELGALMQLRDLESRAEVLGHYETNFADYRQALTMPDLYEDVSATDIAAVAARTFSHSKRTVVVACPEQ